MCGTFYSQHAKYFLAEKVGGALIKGYEKLIKPLVGGFNKFILDPARFTPSSNTNSSTRDSTTEWSEWGCHCSKNTDFTNQRGTKSIGGAALGTIKSMVFGGPGGILGTLVGGPIGGAIVGK